MPLFTLKMIKDYFQLIDKHDTLIMNARFQRLEWWQWAVGSNTLHSWLFVFLNFWIVNKRSDWQQILNQVGTKKALETIMNMQVFLREDIAESNEISRNKSYGLSYNETINTFFTNMKRHFQFFIVRCWLLYYCNLPTCTMGFKQNRRDKTADFLI